MDNYCKMFGFIFVFGFLLGAFTVSVPVLIAPIGLHDQALEVIQVCELELPRNQKCVLTAVPE